MQEPTTLFPVLLLPGSTRMDKELDQNKKVLEANLLKLLDPGQYYNPHLVKQLNEAGITVPDRNILSQLTDKSKLRDNGCIEYLRSKQQRQRKPTEYDHELYTYPYNYKQLHDDHVDNRVGTHYDREAPALDEVLLTAETAENVFRKNKRAADTAVQKCVADTFFAGDITDADLPKTAVGAEYMIGNEKDNMITPLFKTIITAALKKSDTDHRVNRPYKPQILVHNDFTRKKSLAKSFEAQMHKLKSDSRKLHCQQRQITDFKSTGNFWRLTQKRLYSRASSRCNSAQSPRQRRGRSAPGGFLSRPGGGYIDHFPPPPAHVRDSKRNSRDCTALVAKVSVCSRDFIEGAVSQALSRVERAAPAVGGSIADSGTQYSDDFHTVSDIRPFSEHAGSLSYNHENCTSIKLDDPPCPSSTYTIYTSSFEDNIAESVYKRAPIIASSMSMYSSTEFNESDEDDEYDSDEERQLQQSRLNAFKTRMTGGPPTTGNKFNAGSNRNRATIVREAHRGLLPAGSVSIHEDDAPDPDREAVDGIMNAKPKAVIPFSSRRLGDVDEEDDEEEEYIEGKPGLPAFSPIRPKTNNSADLKSPLQTSGRKLSVARPQSAPVSRRPPVLNKRSSGDADNARHSSTPDSRDASEARSTNCKTPEIDLSFVPQERKSSTMGRRTSIYTPEVARTASVQYARPSFGQEEDDEFGLGALEDESSLLKDDNDQLKSGNEELNADFTGTDDINPNDFDNVKDWLAAQMQVVINEINQPQDKPKREFPPKRVLAGEIAILFRGFQIVDRTSSDSLLSLSDMMAYCKVNKVPLKKAEVEHLLWILDDNRRGSVSFEDVKSCYIDQRKRMKYFSCADVSAAVPKKPSSSRSLSSNKLFSSKSNSSRKHIFRKPPSNGLPDDAEIVRAHSTSRSLVSDPIVLFRLLFFAANQDENGYVNLLAVYQHYSQLYATAAEERFRFVYQKEVNNLEDTDRMHISELIRNTTKRTSKV